MGTSRHLLVVTQIKSLSCFLGQGVFLALSQGACEGNQGGGGKPHPILQLLDRGCVSFTTVGVFMPPCARFVFSCVLCCVLAKASVGGNLLRLGPVFLGGGGAHA